MKKVKCNPEYSITEVLEKLEKLRDKNWITDEMFNNIKENLLKKGLRKNGR